MGRILDLLKSQGVPLSEEPKRQILSLDREFDDMESQIRVLETENLRLKSQVNPLEREIEYLRKQVEAVKNQKASAHKDDLDETAVDLLFAIANMGNHRFPESRAGMVIKANPAKTSYYIALLRNGGYIVQSAYAPEIAYRAEPKGLQYLNNKGRL